jgi:hypothetical protein
LAKNNNLQAGQLTWSRMNHGHLKYIGAAILRGGSIYVSWKDLLAEYIQMYLCFLSIIIFQSLNDVI